MNNSIKRIIVVRSDDKLGETLLATPVFQALKEAVDGLYIEAWFNPRWRSLVEASPWIDAVRGVPYRPSWLHCWRLALELHRQRPDAVLILRPDTRRFAWIAKKAGVCLRVGAVQGRPSVRRLLTHVVKLEPKMHQVERNLAIAEAVVGHALPRYPLHFAPRELAALPAAIRALPERSYAVLHLGTGGVQPHWLPERFAAVANWLARQHHLLPVLTGAPGDITMAKRCLQSIQSNAINLVGAITVLELAEVLRRARLLISVDTGVVHLTAAVGTPCVTLHFRRDYPPHQWHAWQVPSETVVPDEHCPGCTRIRCQHHPTTCVASLREEAVIEATERLLAHL